MVLSVHSHCSRAQIPEFWPSKNVISNRDSFQNSEVTLRLWCRNKSISGLILWFRVPVGPGNKASFGTNQLSKFWQFSSKSVIVNLDTFVANRRHDYDEMDLGNWFTPRNGHGGGRRRNTTLASSWLPHAHPPRRLAASRQVSSSSSAFRHPLNVPGWRVWWAGHWSVESCLGRFHQRENKREKGRGRLWGQEGQVEEEIYGHVGEKARPKLLAMKKAERSSEEERGWRWWG